MHGNDILALHVLLRRKPLFQHLSDEDFNALPAILERRALASGEVLFEEGDPGDSLYIVGEGVLSVRIGKDLIGQLRAGDVSGEGACIDPAPRSATLRAEGKATVFALSQEGLRGLLQRAPGTATALIGGIIAQTNARLRDTQQRIDEALHHPAGMEAISAVLPRVDTKSAGATPTPYRGTLDLAALRQARGLSEHDLEMLQVVAPPMRYPDKAVLCEEGWRGSTCFLIAQGLVEVLRTVDGVPRLQAVLAPGALGGQVALVDHGPRSATLRARGEVVALHLDRDDFEKLLRVHSPLALRFQEQVAVAAVRQRRAATELLVALLARLATAPPSKRETHLQKLAYLRTSTGEWSMPPANSGQG